MERLTYFENGYWRLDFNGCQYQAGFVDRLADYEDTGLTPGEIKSMQEEHFSGLEMAKLHSALMELKKYQEADKDGRIAVLPCDVGGSMLDMSDIEHPKIMKGLHFAVAYESVRGIIFYQPYNVASPRQKYSGIEIAINPQGMLRVRVYDDDSLETQDIVHVKYCPMCGRSGGEA